MFKLLKKILALLFKSSNKCYYMNSTNILPPPLDEEEEYNMLLKVENQDLDARNTLIIHNLRLVVFISKKFESTKIPLDDLVSIGTIGLIKGIETFKLDKNIKLATYASRCIENEILMYLRKTQKSRNDCSLDEVLSIDSDGNEMVLSDILASTDPSSLTNLEHDEDIDNLYYAISKLSKREKDIIIKRFGLFGEEELTQKEVADMLGISQSYISRLEKRILEKMRHIIEERIKVA